MQPRSGNFSALPPRPTPRVTDPAPAGLRRGARSGSVAVALALACALWSAPLTDFARWTGLGLFATIAWMVQARVAGFHPHAAFGPANMVTLVRAAGASGLAALAVSPGPSVAMLWSAFALSLGLLLLDGVDGWLARGRAMASRFGARFDMEVDALTILALAALVWQSGEVGPWVLLLGLMRYAFLLAVQLRPALGRPLPPSFRRKAVCVAQLGALTVILAPVIAPPWTGALAFAALVALAWSFLIDLRWLAR